MSSRPDLAASILAAERAGRWVTPPVSLAAATDDPFRLDLPPLAGSEHDDIDGATMELLAGLYLMANLEQTGLLRAAELLIAHRYSLELTSQEAARLLEDLSVESQAWPAIEARQELYTRVFGISAGASGQTAGNTAFEGLLLSLCTAVESSAAPAYGSNAWIPPAHRRTAVVHAVQRLRANLALRQHGNTLFATRRIAEQVRDSVGLLQHPGIIALSRGRSMWDVVRAVWKGEPPDMDVFVTMGQAGQQVVGWAGSPQGEAGEPTSTAMSAASMWLRAVGFGREDAA